MGIFERLIKNHVLANTTFLLVMFMGISSYLLMPREQDPTINFNWINITTVYPGAATPDVEKQITNVLEDAIKNVSDIKFVSSNSRDSISSILVRFEDTSTRIFDKRLADLRREIDSIDAQLPSAALDPFIFEITTANAFPTATVVVSALADDENLRRQAALVMEDIEQIKGVGEILENGLSDPEIHVVFEPQLLEQFAITPVALFNTIQLYYRNSSAGKVDVASSNWAVKITGSRYDLDYIGNIPIVTAQGEITLKQVAQVIQSKEPARELVSYNGNPSVLLSITKKEKQNILQMIERINAFIAQRQAVYQARGITVTLVDDQTQITRDALNVMQTNAMIGLLMVFVVTWIFLGTSISLLTGIAIPFILAGTFWFLYNAGQTLNTSVLLGVVISLGMLVDDAVVVVEAIYYRLQRGAKTLDATLQGLAEVITPVTTAVLTTMAAFLPLMLLPGILGKFMFVIPLVVTSALAVSLIEAYWLLPAHIVALNVNYKKDSNQLSNQNPNLNRIRIRIPNLDNVREIFQRKIRYYYLHILVRVLRCPTLAIVLLVMVFGGAVAVISLGKIKFDFFASDPVRLFYVNVTMPAGTELNTTMDKVIEIEHQVKKNIKQGEVRSVVSYAGQLLTQTEPLFGDQYGQVLVSLKPKTTHNRSVDEMINAMTADVSSIAGTEQTSFLRIAGGPPVTKDISVKVRGNDIVEIKRATEELKAYMRTRAEFRAVADDNLPGQNSMDLQINSAAVQRTGISPDLISRTLRLLVDGEIVTHLRHLGEKVDIRLLAASKLERIDELLEYRLPANDGSLIALRQLVTPTYGVSANSIRHYNYRRAITLQADIDKTRTDTLQANQLLQAHWRSIQSDFSGVDLDFSGILDDLNESLNSIGLLFLMGLGLIYLILGTQFKSYFQPFLIIITVPMAASGVVYGLLLSEFPLSLYTLYGVVALAGIAVNAAIVLISTANNRLQSGMSITNAIIYASRRRVIPIIITSLTTIAGLFSLATGLGGHSLLWGPVAASMVWGLTVSTLLTLFYIPLFFSLFMRPWFRKTGV